MDESIFPSQECFKISQPFLEICLLIEPLKTTIFLKQKQKLTPTSSFCSKPLIIKEYANSLTNTTV